MKKSEVSHAHLDEASRRLKFAKIIAVLRSFTNLKECDVLDIGTGSGYIIYYIAKKARSATSVDIRDERIVKTGYTFVKVGDERLPFKNKTFDVVIYHHVLEHVLNQEFHIKEIHRVLRSDGLVYLSTPNKYWLLDEHYNLPFISWLPRSIGTLYLKLVRNRTWDIYSLSYSQLKELLQDYFEIHNMSLKIIKNPERYKLDVCKKIQPLLKLFPLQILNLLNGIVPSYILVLRKKDTISYP